MPPRAGFAVLIALAAGLALASCKSCSQEEDQVASATREQLAQAEKTLRDRLAQAELNYTLFVGSRKCPKGCEGCLPERIYGLARSAGWITTRCADDSSLEIQLTDQGRSVLTLRAGRSKPATGDFYGFVIARADLHRLEEPVTGSDQTTSLPFTWVYRPTATTEGLLAGGPRDMGRSTYRLCGTGPRWIAPTEDCQAAIQHDKAQLRKQADGGAWEVEYSQAGKRGKGFRGLDLRGRDLRGPGARGPGKH